MATSESIVILGTCTSTLDWICHNYSLWRFSFTKAATFICLQSSSHYVYVLFLVPAGVVSDVQVSINSPSSILVSWQPTDKDNWNGVIQRYTIIYERLRSVGDDVSTTISEGSGLGSIFVDSISIPDAGQRLLNNPDPTLAVLPLRREQVVIEGLEEYHVYQVTVYYETSQGRSDKTSPRILQTLMSGIKCYSY